MCVSVQAEVIGEESCCGVEGRCLNLVLVNEGASLLKLKTNLHNSLEWPLVFMVEKRHVDPEDIIKLRSKCDTCNMKFSCATIFYITSSNCVLSCCV